MPAANETAAPPTQYLTFSLAEEDFAVGVLHVREIVEYGAVTKVPSCPPWIRGVINLRGSVVPVVDLAVKFGLGERPVTNRTCIIMVEVRLREEESVMGVLADGVNQVIALLPDDVEPAPRFGTKVRADYLLGMGRAGTGFTSILDIQRVLSADELLTARAVESTPTEGSLEGGAPDAEAAKREPARSADRPAGADTEPASGPPEAAPEGEPRSRRKRRSSRENDA